MPSDDTDILRVLGRIEAKVDHLSKTGDDQQKDINMLKAAHYRQLGLISGLATAVSAATAFITFKLGGS